MVKNPVAQIYTRRQLTAIVQIFMDRVASSEHDTENQNLVADFQRADFFFGKGEG